MMKTQRGFTLVELMVVLVIIAILTTIAYPSYQEQVRKTRRADCAAALVGLAAAMERHFSTNSSYTGAAASGANTGSPAIYATQCPLDGGAATYNLNISAATNTSYTVTATPTGGQSGDKCGILTLSNTGLKGISNADTGVTVQDCWQ